MSCGTMRRSSYFLAACVGMFVAGAARAQGLSNGTVRQCSDSAPQSELRRTVAYIRSDATDSAPAFVKPVDLLIEILGERVRGSLGANSGDLPIGEPAFTRFNTDGTVVVSIHRDGRMTVAVRGEPGVVDSSRTAGTRRLAELLKKAWDEGERVYWPEKAKEDSARFSIEFWKPGPPRDAPLKKPTGKFAVAVFSIALPWEEGPFAEVFPLPSYPMTAKEKGIEAVITLSFVVDSSGKADVASARDVLPYGAPVPVGDMADRYREFVSASKNVLPKTRFRPAMIAGCRVSQRVEMPFSFSLH